MAKRFMSIWFHNPRTDWFIRRQSHLAAMPFVLSSPDHGRMVVTATCALTHTQGIHIGMAVADAKAIFPSLQVLDNKPELSVKLLTGLAEWCIRFTPVVGIELPDGLLLNITGCAHLWGGENQYLSEIHKRFRYFGYAVNISIANTIGTSWAIARNGQNNFIVDGGEQTTALLPLPPSSLRIDIAIAERLEKLGLRQINNFINMPRPSLRTRFGQELLLQLDKALGHEEEAIISVTPIELYRERLPYLEPIVTATGIEIALQRLLDSLCKRLQQEEKGLRGAILKCYRIDSKIEKIEISINRPTCNIKHLFKLFEIKIETIEPALSIELFTLDAVKVEELSVTQEKLWNNRP